MAVRIPKSIKINTATKSTVPIPVKSIFVWNANNVNPKQTTVVITAAKNTWNQFLSSIIIIHLFISK